MPQIKPFRGVRPAPGFVEKVALQIETLSLEQAKLIRQSNPFSYINMLVPKVNPLFGRASKQELAFKVINENLEDFLEKGILIQDPEPSLYVYKVNNKGLIQNGIWAITSIDDYLETNIRRHELTRPDRERALMEYLRQTGIDANPVLIAHEPDEQVAAIITNTCSTEPLLNFSDGEKDYFLWRISDTANLHALVEIFGKMRVTYIADGHHRAAAASSYGLAQRQGDPRHRGDEDYNFFTSVYMSTAQLRLIAFHRLVKAKGDFDPAEFLKAVSKNFTVERSATNIPVIPAMSRTFGMYVNGAWYTLTALHCGDTGPVGDLDVSILQDTLLSPVLHIQDPRTDPRLHFSGGATPVENLVELVDKGEYTIAFTLFPTSMRQLMDIADAGEVMPPKSTWFEPKFQAGLLIHQIDR